MEFDCIVCDRLGWVQNRFRPTRGLLWRNGQECLHSKVVDICAEKYIAYRNICKICLHDNFFFVPGCFEFKFCK